MYIYIYINIHIHIYVNVYIHIYVYTQTYFSLLYPNAKVKNKCSYIQNLTLDLVQTLKITISNTKHAKNNKLHSEKTSCSKQQYFYKLDVNFNQRLPLNCMARLCWAYIL